MAAIGWFSYKKVLTLWVESKANEWLIVVRNGEMIKKGIGLACWTMPGDLTITFPSLINQVNF